MNYFLQMTAQSTSRNKRSNKDQILHIIMQELNKFHYLFITIKPSHYPFSLELIDVRYLYLFFFLGKSVK